MSDIRNLIDKLIEGIVQGWNVLTHRNGHILIVEWIPVHTNDAAFTVDAKRVKPQDQFITQLQGALLVKGQGIVGGIFRYVVGVADILHQRSLHDIDRCGASRVSLDADGVTVIFNLSIQKRNQLHDAGSSCCFLIDPERHFLRHIHIAHIERRTG